jgi:uncharacterized protein YeaC (DUF1315 family)
MTQKTVFYKKVGRRYVPVNEYDQELLDSFPKGTHLVMCYPGGQSRRHCIDPNYAAMIAAGRVAEDAICQALVEADTVKPPDGRKMTQAELDAWLNLIAVWGDRARTLPRAAMRDIAEAGVKAMQQEANKLMQHESVHLAWDHFQTVCALTQTQHSA